MITAVEGTLEARGGDWAVVKVGGVSLRLQLPAPAVAELGEVGQKVTLQVAAEARAEPALRVAALDLLCDLQVDGALAMVRTMLPSESGAIQVAAMRAFSRLGNKELASEARSLVEQLGGKAVPIKDSGGKEVEGQHTPLLIHAAAALARWQ